MAVRPSYGLQTPREEIAFTTARPKIHTQSQILGTAEAYFGPIFQLCIFDLCLHWVSVVRGLSEVDTIKVYFSNLPLKPWLN